MKRIKIEYWIFIVLCLMLFIFIGCVKQIPKQETVQQINAQLFNKSDNERFTLVKTIPYNSACNKELDEFMAGKVAGIRNEEDKVIIDGPVDKNMSKSDITIENNGTTIKIINK